MLVRHESAISLVFTEEPDRFEAATLRSGVVTLRSAIGSTNDVEWARVMNLTREKWEKFRDQVDRRYAESEKLLAEPGAAMNTLIASLKKLEP